MSKADLIALAIERAGGMRALAEELGISYQAVQSWRKSRIPAERVLEIEHLTGIPRTTLRPDLYGTYVPARRKKQHAD